MFQLERLTVVKETLSQILEEMYDERIETTKGMIEATDIISRLSERIKEKVIRERIAREEAGNDSKRIG